MEARRPGVIADGSAEVADEAVRRGHPIGIECLRFGVEEHVAELVPTDGEAWVNCTGERANRDDFEVEILNERGLGHIVDQLDRTLGRDKVGEPAAAMDRRDHSRRCANYGTAPTGGSFEVAEHAMYRVVDGRFVEMMDLHDYTEIARQLRAA